MPDRPWGADFEEEEAFSAVLQDLRMLAASDRRVDAPGDDGLLPDTRCQNERFRTIRILGDDLDLAYQRLGYAA